MTYDLHDGLRDLERTAPLGTLDVRAIELGARRHRRTLVARRAGGTLALVVVAVAAVTLGGRLPEPRSAPPAAPSGDLAPRSVDVRCGDPAPTPTVGPVVVVPVPQIEGPGGVPQGRMTTVVALVNDAGEPLVVRERAAVTYLVDASGRVVQTSDRTGDGQPVQMSDQGWRTVGEAMDLRACDGSSLPDGDYTVHAATTLSVTSSDEPLHVVGGGVRVVVRDGRVQHDLPTAPAGRTGQADLLLTLAADPTTGLDVTVDRGSVPDGLLVLLAQVVATDAAGNVVSGAVGTSVVVPAGSATGSVWVPSSASQRGPEGGAVDGVASTNVVVVGYLVTEDGHQRVVSGAIDVTEQSTP